MNAHTICNSMSFFAIATFIIYLLILVIGGSFIIGSSNLNRLIGLGIISGTTYLYWYK